MAQQASQAALQSQLIDLKTGMFTWTGLKLFQQWQQQLGTGFDPAGNLVSNIESTVGVVGRGGTLASVLQYISDDGVVSASGMAPATSTDRGSVVLPAGASSNILGSAAIEPAGAFDVSGAAATAQTAAQNHTDASFALAESHADNAAATAQANAEAFSSNAGNLTSGTVPLARLPGLTVTVTTAALTSGGTQGSQTFTNGSLVAQVQAT